MGGCLSSATAKSPSPPSAKVISLNGSLLEYPVPILVSQVLIHAQASSSSSSSSSKIFLCNSDGLYYDQPIPALGSEDQLHANCIYFVLPASKLERPLSASDMAALAVKASIALQKAESHRRKKARISPVLFVNQNYSVDREAVHVDRQFVNQSRNYAYEYDITIGRPTKKKPPPPPSSSFGISRSGSVKRLQRFTSRRAKLAVRSFRLRLSTIYEGTVL